MILQANLHQPLNGNNMRTIKGFSYNKTPYRYVAKYKNNKWNKGRLTTNDKVVLSESASILQYCQQVFEGMKAFKTKDNRVVVFRPNLNFERLNKSAIRMSIPEISKEMFYEALNLVVKANIEEIPSYESGGSLYLRPFIFGTSPILGVKASSEYEFRLFASPVMPYFDQNKLVNLRVSDYDRAAPQGTGHIKAGLNYALSIFPGSEAHKLGFDENLYLDSKSRTFVEETGGANILFVDKNNKLITPLSPTILPSITRKSILYIAESILGIEVEERQIEVSELKDFVECGLCGTASIISPVGSITNNGEVVNYTTHKTLLKIRELLLDIQKEEVKAPKDWIYEIK